MTATRWGTSSMNTIQAVNWQTDLIPYTVDAAYNELRCGNWWQVTFAFIIDKSDILHATSWVNGSRQSYCGVGVLHEAGNAAARYTSVCLHCYRSALADDVVNSLQGILTIG